MMRNPYVNKSFIVLFRRNSKSKTPVYYYKFEDFYSLQEQSVTNKSLNWKESIVSSLFIHSSYREDLSLQRNETDTFAVRLIIHSAKDILVGQSYSSANAPTFAQFYLTEQTKQIQNNSEENEDGQINTLIPIIHITLSNIYIDNMYGDNVELPTFIPRSYQIMDSSIWNYLVPINGIPKTNNNPEITVDERFIDVVDSIYNNYEKGLYSLSVAHEYADLNARLSVQSFLSGAHASGVAPFIFHSESAIKRMIDEEFCEHKDNSCEGWNTINNIRERRWRILLVDDKAIAPMDTIGCLRENNKEFSWNCKLTIIRDVLEKKFGLKGKIHCKACKENVSDATLSFNINKENTVEIDKIQKELNDIKDAIIIKSIGNKNIDSEEKARIIQKERKEILCDILPMGEPIEGYKFYFNNKAVSTEYWKEVYRYLQSNLPKEIEVIEGCPSSTQILIEYAQNISEAETALKEKKYDIILLDYLLNGSKGKEKEYGYKLLDDIYVALKSYKDNFTLNEDGYKIGPCDRYFFIFISAYSSAVYERLLAEGLNRSEKYWHIAVGACPTNTPQLFLYNLIKLMEKRLDDSGIERLSAKGIFEVVNEIFGDDDGYNTGKPVRYKANKYYQKVLDMHYLYKKMLNDVQIPSGKSQSIFNTTGSVLMTHFISKNVNLGGFLEHLTQLVHLTAFGTVRQWPEMWEEYIYFKAQFNFDQFKEDCKVLKWDAEEKFNGLCIALENHILSLKSN